MLGLVWPLQGVPQEPNWAMLFSLDTKSKDDIFAILRNIFPRKLS